VKSFGLGETLVDEVNIPLRRGDAGLRFLLKACSTWCAEQKIASE